MRQSTDCKTTEEAIAEIKGIIETHERQLSDLKLSDNIVKANLIHDLDNFIYYKKSEGRVNKKVD